MYNDQTANNNVTYTYTGIFEETEEDKIKRLEKEVKEKTEILRLMKELKKLKEDIKTEEIETLTFRTDLLMKN